MKTASFFSVVIALAFLGNHVLRATDDKALSAVSPPSLEEHFDADLSPDWFWGLGTWTAKDGILRGFESGPRRHGPVKMRRFSLGDGTVECEFRLVGKASFAGLIFNGSQERGHIVHLVVGQDQIRLLAHPRKGEVVELAKVSHTLSVGEWHRIKMQFRGETLNASVDEIPLSASHACLAEQKLTFGLGGDSGGPAGESAGALEFRRLKVAKE